MRANPKTPWTLVAVLAAACGDDLTRPPPPGAPSLEPAFVSETFAGCLFASPRLVDAGAGRQGILVASGDGRVAALDPTGGETIWNLVLDAPEGTTAHVAATPGVFDGATRAVVAWQDVLPDLDRTAHHVAVVDTLAGALDPAFPAVTLDATGQSVDGDPVPFSPANAYSRSAIPIATPAGSTRGLAYVSFGNIRDIQPWHGWVFELDLDAWQGGGAGAAVTGVLLTTPEIACGTPGDSGADDMICGGGVWAPPGPTVFPSADGATYELIVPTGNGQLDLDRDDYANTLMRTGRGLAFDPACDPDACADFDPIDPSPACVDSCADLFIPRLLPGQPMFDPPDGRCEGKTFFECYALLDYDLGANVPARIELPGGPTVLVLPAKDGGVYLIDADHLGRLYDRLQIMPVCGSDGGTCSANWAGMMVTEPAVAWIDGEPTILIATFVHDGNHPAGVIALGIDRGPGGTGDPRLVRQWEAPDFETERAEALDRFRRHDSRVALVDHAGATYAVVVDVGPTGAPGTMLLIDVRAGRIVDRATLSGRGQRFIAPLVIGDRIVVTSCESNDGPGHAEAWDLVTTTR